MNSTDIFVQIKEIQRQLWLGHASLMVGCGFSRNANKATPTTPTPPSWIELTDKLIEHLYSDCDERERSNIRASKNVLQLADEFDIAFQRPALNMLLKECIQDDNLLPSKLYTQMLELPWVDVFTTNYDTLLERASQQIVNIKYDVVLDCKDLPYSESPRIIKLHGSFPSESTHLIVSEEDYRTYPTKYSPFVNTVQQAIMESTLCLIGFSGTDPNFQKWIGWVKDNLHDSMPPIYLVGMFSLSASERKVLESKKIIPVDLSCLPNIDLNDYAKALAEFFKLLSVKPIYYNWPQEQRILSPRNDSSEQNFISVIKKWKKERESYPNWLVLPWDKLSIMVMFTEQWTNYLDEIKNLSGFWDINGLYEFNWRLEKCLMPIFNHLIPCYERVIDKYDPYGVKDIKNINSELQPKWLDLCFAILRWSREELDENRWSKYLQLLEKITENDVFSQNRLYYEQVFHAMALPDLDLVRSIVKKWEGIKRPLVWQAKLASIFCMLGESDKASLMWTDALNNLRPHIPKSKIKNDFYLLSLEGSILVNLCRSALYNNIPDANKEDKNLRIKYQDRLHELEAFGCNPWENIDKFSLFLENSRRFNAEEQITRNFKSKTSSFTLHNGWNPTHTKAFQSLRFFEEIGIPFVDGNASKTLRSSLLVIADYSPSWAFCVLNIIGCSNIVSCELMFSQEKLYHISAEKINSLAASYCRQLEYVISSQKKYLSQTSNNFYTQISKNLIEVISRLTVKANEENLQRILSLGIRLYELEDNVVHNLGSGYFKRMFDAMHPQQIFDNLDILLSIPIPIHKRSHWQPPTLFIDWRGFKVTPRKCSSKLKHTINNLIAELDTTNDFYRSNVLSYLYTCIDANLLSVKQKKNIAENLRRHLPTNQLPSIEYFHRDAYKDLLAPLGLDDKINHLLKEYYFKESVALFNNNSNSVFVINLYRDTRFIQMSKSLLATCSIFNQKEKYYFDLSIDECLQLFRNLKTAWVNSKQNISDALERSSISLKEQRLVIEDTLYHLDLILGEIIIPRTSTANFFPQILSFVQELKKYFYFPVATIAICCNMKKYDEDFFIETIAAINGDDRHKFKAFSYSVYNAYRFAKYKKMSIPSSLLIDSLIGAIYMKTDENFRIACGTLGSILDFHILSKMERKILLCALENLLDGTSFKSENNRFSMQDRYDYRQAATFLAAKLYYSFLKEKIEIPSVLQAWIDLRESTEELPDIRNTWTKVINFYKTK